MILSPGTRILYRDDEDRSLLIPATVLEQVSEYWYEIREDGGDDTPHIHVELVAEVLR